MPSLSQYRKAQLQARALAGSLSSASVRRIEKSVREYAKSLAAQIAALPAGNERAALIASRKIALATATDLHKKLETLIVEQRAASFEEIESIWRAAGLKAAKVAGVPNALMGNVRVPPLSLMGAYESLGGGAATWATRLTTHVTASASEVDGIVRAGIMEGVHPEELARRIRPYVQGAEEFHQAFPTSTEAFKALHDFRRVNPELRDAAKKVKYNALRIAFSETHNARAEAELAHFALDPLVESVRWTLSPFRGALDGPDECDVLATNDFFGLGAGIYPISSVPVPPHPFDRCERVPVLRDASVAHLPKPTPARIKSGNDAVVPNAGSVTVSDAQRMRIRARAEDVLAATDQVPAQAGVQALMQASLNEGKTIALGVLPKGPATIKGVTFPTGIGLTSKQHAELLVTKAAKGTKKAIAELQAFGVDTAALEQKAAAKKAAAAAKKAAKAAPPVPPPVPAPTIGLDATTILGRQIAPAAGSNAGGTYLGTDGIKRYVKFYDDPAQARGEHLANAIYRSLGFDGPQSFVFEHQGKLAYASEVIEGGTTLQQAKLTAARANQLLDGFAADVLTANWDAVGASLDNILVTPAGKLIRIDNGGAFLMRAKAGRKPVAALTNISEWDVFASAKNPSYQRLFSAAGVRNADELGQRAIAQIDRILELEQKSGGWSAFVRTHLPDWNGKDRDQVVQMLEVRAALLKKKRNDLAAAIAKPKPTVTGPFRDKDATLYLDKRFTGTPAKLTAGERRAIHEYTGSSYRSWNSHLRGGGTPSSSMLDLDTAIAKHEVGVDLIVYRGLGSAHPIHKLGVAALKKRVGQSFTDPAFMSTSTNQSTAISFAGGTNWFLEIRVPKHAKGWWGKAHGSHRGENELILPRGSKVRVLEVREETQGYAKLIRVIVELEP